MDRSSLYNEEGPEEEVEQDKSFAQDLDIASISNTIDFQKSFIANRQFNMIVTPVKSEISIFK